MGILNVHTGKRNIRCSYTLNTAVKLEMNGIKKTGLIHEFCKHFVGLDRETQHLPEVLPESLLLERLCCLVHSSGGVVQERSSGQHIS